MKLLVIGGLVLFVGFWMVEAPTSLANFSQDGATWAWEMTTTVFDSVISFLSALFD